MFDTYTTLGGQVLDLRQLTDVECEFFGRVLDAYRARDQYKTVDRLIHTTDNPQLRKSQGVLTREIYGSTLYTAVRDLVDRLGILQGELGASPSDLVDEDPTADEWIPVAEAAASKGVTVPGLHEAIKRGEVIARPAKVGSKHLVVSTRSLAAYRPSPARQRAGSQSRSGQQE